MIFLRHAVDFACLDTSKTFDWENYWQSWKAAQELPKWESTPTSKRNQEAGLRWLRSMRSSLIVLDGSRSGRVFLVQKTDTSIVRTEEDHDTSRKMLRGGKAEMLSCGAISHMKGARGACLSV